MPFPLCCYLAATVLPTTGEHVAGAQISEFMLISGTVPPRSRAASLVGGLAGRAADLDMVEALPAAPYFATHASSAARNSSGQTM